MKIIQIISEFHLAGGQRMCEDLIYGLLKKGNDVIAISLFSHKTEITNRLETAGVKIYYLNKKNGLDFSMFKAIHKVLKIEKPDVVHIHLNAFLYSAPATIFSGVRCKVNTIHTLANRNGSKLDNLFRRLFYKFFNVIPVALSAIVQDSIADEYKIQKNKIPVIFNGINLDNCIVKEDYEIKDKFKILHIGRFCAVKNHTELIKGFSIFHNKFPDSELWLIGTGEEIKKAESLINSLNLVDSVFLLGEKGNVYPYLNDADIFVLPSLQEGMPITLIEALGSAIPILTSGVGGITDMIENGKEALFCGTDADSISKGLEKLYTNSDFRKELGRNALITSKKFSSEEMAEKYFNLYKNILKQ